MIFKIGRLSDNASVTKPARSEWVEIPPRIEWGVGQARLVLDVRRWVRLSPDPARVLRFFEPGAQLDKLLNMFLGLVVHHPFKLDEPDFPQAQIEADSTASARRA